MAALVSLAAGRVMEGKSFLIAAWCQLANLLPLEPQVIARRFHSVTLGKARAKARAIGWANSGVLSRYAGGELHLAGGWSLQEIYECGQWLFELRWIRAGSAGPSYYIGKWQPGEKFTSEKKLQGDDESVRGRQFSRLQGRVRGRPEGQTLSWSTRSHWHPSQFRCICRRKVHLFSVHATAASLSDSQCHVSLPEPARTGAPGFFHRKSQPLHGPSSGHHEWSLQQSADQHFPSRLPDGGLPLRTAVRTHVPGRRFLPVLLRAGRTGSREGAGLSVQQGPVAEVPQTPDWDDHHQTRKVRGSFTQHSFILQ